MPDPVLSRPMFGNGQQPTPPSPDLSGLAPKGQAAERAGLYAVAKATDDFSNQVQQAGDYEQLMNTIRGDNKTIEDRRSELAGIVGVLDAQRTPVSVLTVMQPAIELLSNQQTPSGITSLVDDGSEAPAEEPQRFAKGGLVQRRRYADGGLAASAAEYDRMLQQRLGPERSIDDYVAERQRILGGQDTSNLDANLALMGYGARVATTPGNLITALASPLPDFGKELSGIANKKSDRDRAIRLNALEARDKDKDKRQTAGIDALKTAFTEYNTNQRTAQQIEATRQENEKNRTFQAGESALDRSFRTGERLGSEAFQTGMESNRQGFQTRERLGTQDYQTGARKDEQQFRTGEREAGQQFQTGERKDTQQFQERMAGENRKFVTSERVAGQEYDREKTAGAQKFQTSEREAGQGFQSGEAEKGRQFQREQTGVQLNAHPETPYVIQDGANTILIRAKPSRDGWVDATTGQPLPKNATPLNELTFRLFGGEKGEAKDAQNYILKDGTRTIGIQRGTQVLGLNGKPLPADAVLDKNNEVSQPFNMVVEDPSKPAGVSQTLGRQRGSITEIQEKGQWVPIDPQKNYARGEIKDVMNPQADGRVVITWGPMQGKNFKVGPASGTNINTDSVPSPNDLKGTTVAPAPAPAPQQRTESTVTPDVAPAAQAAQDALQRHKPAERDKFTIGAITGEGSEGRFTKTLPKPYVTWDRMPDDDKNKTLDRINYSQAFLKSSDEFLKAIPEAVGPYNQVKSFSTNVIAPFLPEGFGYEKMAWLKTEQAKRQLQDLRQQLRQSQSLNPRFPVGELNVIDELAENPDKFFANPAAGLARLKETIRVTRNNLEYDRARLENRQPLYIDRVPEGTKDDPLPANRADYIYDLRKQGVSTKGIHIADDKGNIIRLSE